MWEKASSGSQSVEKLILSNDKCLIINFACFFAHVLFSPFFLRECILFQMSLFWVKNFIKVGRKKTVLSSKTLPGSSLRARSLTAPPHPTLPPIPAERNIEILEMSVGAFAFSRWSQETVFVRLTVININLHSRYISYHWTVSIINCWKKRKLLSSEKHCDF